MTTNPGKSTTALATEQIKGEHDAAFRDCRHLVARALERASTYTSEGLLVESQQIYIARMRRLQRLVSELWAEPLE